MSYLVLARKYRSDTFDEVVGQNHIAQTLKKAIETDRIAHAYLFTGTRGTGKTSMARILAKALNCEKSKGPTAEPCLKCNSCVAIARGDDMDVIEIDAASNTQVEKTREIIDNAQYRPARSRFKVYIIDEVHMLSKSSFNALLKTLEEPPSHVKFILATTEPEKVLPTILSRCQRYDFRNISTREIAEHLKSICKDEKIKADEDALMLVAKAGAGSMRDALSLLERLRSVGDDRLTVQSIEQLLGLPRGQAVFDLAQAIGEGRVKDVLTLVDRMVNEGMSPDGLIVSLIDHLRNLLILRTCGSDSNLVEAVTISLDDLAKQAEQFEAATLTQDITILEELRRHLRQSQAGRAIFDATLVRLALAEQFTAIGDLLAHVDGGAAPGATAIQKKKPEPVIEAKSTAIAVAAKEPTNIEPVNDADLPKVWKGLLDALAAHGAALHSLVSHGELTAITDGQAVITYGAEHETFPKMLGRNGKKELVSEALSRVLGKSVGVRFELRPVSGEVESPRVERPPAVASEIERHPAAPPSLQALTQDQKAELGKDPLIGALISEFGATILKVSENV
jgi:DNA polymerase-3 subunit gamma/tau